MNPIAVRALGVRYGRVTALDGVTFDVPPGAVYVLLGRSGAGKSSLARCVLGRQKPTAGRVLLSGRNARRSRLANLLRPFGFDSRVVPASLPDGGDPLRGLARALDSRPGVLVLDDPTHGLDAASARAFLEAAAGERDRGTTLLLLTSDPEGAERIASHVGVLRNGRLAVNDEIGNLGRRFRRIRYRNEITEERTEYGTELDAFDAVRVKVRGWGVEAVVSNFDDGAFASFAVTEGVVEARAEALSLEEIFAAVAGEGSATARP
ncbi:MAG TPA: ATP-binding cassette domain-containing protein [Thermoanaerobaculia bacterium]|nr:ATP-binding cassette domain-containing protein [Thermoanaerobaculia bacterium]